MLRSLLNRFRQKGLGAEIARGAAGSLGIKVGQTILALGLAVLLARVLGPEGFGVYSYAQALIMVAALPVEAGIATLLTREIAAGQQRGDWGLVRGLLRRPNQGVLGYGLLVMAGGAGALVVLDGRLDSSGVATLSLALLLFPLLALVRLNAGMLRVLRHVLAAQIPDQILRQLLLILFVGGALFLADEATPQLAMGLHALAAGLALVLGLVWIARVLPSEIRSEPPRYEMRAWLSALLPLTLIGGMQVINNQFDILMLGPLAGAESVGIYRVAVQGATLVAFALTAVNMVIGPHIARLYSAGDQQRLQRMVSLSAQAILGLAIPAAGIFILFGGPILGWLFGEAYSDGGLALAILCAGQLVNAAMGSVGLILNMTGHERDTALGVGVAAALNVVLNLVLIPPFGIEGAAVATAISTTVWNVLLAQRVYARTGLISFVIPVGRSRRQRTVNS